MSDKNLEIELESSDRIKDFNETIVDTDKLIDNLKTLIDSNNLLLISKVNLLLDLQFTPFLNRGQTNIVVYNIFGLGDKQHQYNL